MATRRPVLRGGQASEKNSVAPLQVADLTGGILEAHTQQRSIGLERDDPDHHRTQPEDLSVRQG